MTVTVTEGASVVVDVVQSGSVTVTGATPPSVEVTEMVIGATQTAPVVEEVDASTIVTEVDTTGAGVKGDPGAPGAPGSEGPEGPPGADGADGTSGSIGFTFTQDVQSTTWTIVHNLGRRPDIALYDTAGTNYPIFSSTAPDLNTVILTFSRPLSGTAYLI